jgi:hypothetical protein
VHQEVVSPADPVAGRELGEQRDEADPHTAQQGDMGNTSDRRVGNTFPVGSIAALLKEPELG